MHARGGYRGWWIRRLTTPFLANLYVSVLKQFNLHFISVLCVILGTLSRATEASSTVT